MGTSKLMIPVPLFDLKSLGTNLRQAVQGLQIGGTRTPGSSLKCHGMRLLKAEGLDRPGAKYATKCLELLPVGA